MHIYDPLMVKDRPAGKITPQEVEKAWGYELWIHNSEDYCMKVLHIDAGETIRSHLHVDKNETWYIMKGTARVIYYKDRMGYHTILQEGESFQIPPGLIHSVHAIGGPVKILEASTQHFDSDTIRI